MCLIVISFVVVADAVDGADELMSRHSMACLTRSVAGSSTVLNQAHTDSSTSLDQVDFRWSSDVDLAAYRDQALASDIAAHQADTRSVAADNKLRHHLHHYQLRHSRRIWLFHFVVKILVSK